MPQRLFGGKLGRARRLSPRGPTSGRAQRRRPAGIIAALGLATLFLIASLCIIAAAG